MNQPEMLKSTENKIITNEENQPTNNSLTKTEVEEIYSFRQNCLQRIRSVISLKFYHQISEKLETEKRLFQQLLNWEDNKQDVLSRYSFVLNPYYFEQKFLT